MSACTRVRVSITGVVQGVGFRPTVARVAAVHRLSGFVLNDAGSVQCELQGPGSGVDAAVHALRTDPPPLARIDSFDVTTRPLRDGEVAFRILDSARRTDGRHRTLVPPDVATCADCRRELFDPADRRYGHPFITCTNCGPRYTVITDLPYDRPATTMAGFGMCARCAAEYTDPADRRYHAQTIACHDCGPRLTWDGPGTGGSALASAGAALRAGAILAIKGIGGYHLACRADDDAAVALLRQRKNRPAKPFAVMVADVDRARRICVIDDAAERALTSPAAPIVLLPAPAGGVSGHVAPGLTDLGVMLAYTPVHHLLFADVDVPALVMTSANQGGSPIVYRDENLHWIDGLADAVLGHDRPIHVPCEDSVLAIDEDGADIPLRRSRGYAPLPLPLDAPDAILATGGDLKTTFALTDGQGRAHLSSHLGDMADPRTQDCFTAAVDHLMSLTATVPTVVAHDMHPRYATTGWARRHTGRLEAVQHHHAHAVSLLVEHRMLGRPMIAIAYDGTGFGTDGTIWGGEVLAITGPAAFTRVGHLAPFWLPGGEAAVRQPARIALDLLRRAEIDPARDLPPVTALGPTGMHVLTQQFARGLGCVTTTSMGRLFDAVASLLGVCQQVTYEGQAAIELEHLARRGRPGAAPHVDVVAGVLDPAPLIAGLVDGLRAGAATEDLARSFHDAVIDASVRVAAACAADAGITTVGLTGGVFANRLLLEGISAGLRGRGLEVLTHRVVPCNDGGLALGQAAIAALRRSAPRERSSSCASVSPAG